MTWRRWKLGFLLALLESFFIAGAGLSALAELGAAGAILSTFCAAAAARVAAWRKQHPVDEISFDTSRLSKPMNEKLPLIMALAWLFTGCALNSQYARTTSTDTAGVVSVTEARSKLIAVGDARNSLDKVRASAGKTSSVGASGISEETTTTNIANNARALIDLVKELKSP
jgi:hypothetical protein